MQAIPIALAAVSTLTSGVGGILQIQAERNNAKIREAVALRQAEIERRNRRIDEQNLIAEQQRANQELLDQGLEALVQKDAEVAAQGASGISLTSDSFARIRSLTANLARRDAERIQFDSALRKRRINERIVGTNERIANAEQEAVFAKAAKSNAIPAGIFNIAGGLITGASQVNLELERKAARGALSTTANSRLRLNALGGF